MATYSTSDLSRRSGDIIAEALRRPVTIVQRNKPRLVLLTNIPTLHLTSSGITNILVMEVRSDPGGPAL